MKQRHLIGVFFLMWFYPCYSQDDRVMDSLLAILKKPVHDTTKINTLTAVSKRFLQLNKLPQANDYAKQALKLSQDISFIKGEAGIHQHIGMIKTREYNFPEALKSFQSFLRSAEQLNDKQNISRAYITIANTHFQQGNYMVAIQYHQLSLKLKVELRDDKGLIQCYNNIGLCYWNAGNYPLAYENYKTALKVRESIRDSMGIAHSYNVLGVVYDDEGNYPESLKNYLASLSVYEKMGKEFGIAACNNNIGELYRKQNNYKESLYRYGLALEYYLKANDQGGIAMAYNNIGEVYRLQRKYDEALKNFLSSEKIDREINDKYGLAAASGNIGAVYYELALIKNNLTSKVQLLDDALRYSLTGLENFKIISQKDGMAGSYILMGMINTEQKNYVAARENLMEGLRLAKESGVKERIKDSYEALSKLDSATGNWDGAFNNRNSFYMYRDSLLNKENTQKLTQLQMQFDFDKREAVLLYEKDLANERFKQQALLSAQHRKDFLLSEAELELANNEKSIQVLLLDKNRAEFAAQKAESEKNKEQLVVLNKEKDIQMLALKKQRQLKTYLLAGLLLFVVLSFFIYRNYQTRQQLKLQMLRNKIASDLHDDVGSTLSSISIFSQMAQEQSKETIPLLESIGDSSRKMLDAMADIVWTIKPENDQFEKIIMRMRSFAFELLGAKKIDFEFAAEDDVANLKLPMETRRNLYLIFKEATNNLVKYSQASKAEFSISGEKNSLVMRIRDNGKGFDPNRSSQGNGLMNMRRRAKEIGGELKIDSNSVNGTIIELRIAV